MENSDLSDRIRAIESMLDLIWAVHLKQTGVKSDSINPQAMSDTKNKFMVLRMEKVQEQLKELEKQEE